MFELVLDLAEFRKKARQMGVFADDQLPFAMSKTLNDTMFKDVRPDLIGPTWASAFKVRNSGLARAAINVSRPYATKANWSAGVDGTSRAARKTDIAVHATGGGKIHSGTLAVPQQGQVRLHSRGKKPWARELEKKYGKRAVRKTAAGLFVGKGGRLHLYYGFAESARLSKRYRFYEAFRVRTLRGLAQRFPANLQHAINTSFGR